MPTTKQVVVGTLSALAVGSICYAVYFDYKRRNDPQFRKKLKKQRKMAKKIRNAKSENKKSVDDASLKIESQIEAIKKVINDEPIPTEMEAKESFFMQQLQKGEMLSYQGEPYYEVSALCYYRAFKVYPNPTELIVLFQRSTPEPVYKKIIEMISADVKKKQEEYFNLYPGKDMNVKIDKKDYDIVVTKDIAAGEIIYKEKPMMATLDPRVENTNYCSHCLKRFEGEGVRGKDKNVIFCSKECSEESWNKYNKYLYQPTLDDITEALKSGDKIEITNADPVGNEAPATIVAEGKPEETTTEEKKDEKPEEAKEEEDGKKTELEDVDKFWKLLKETKRTCPIMIARFVAKMIDRELNGKPQNEEYSDWDHLERFKFLDELESSEDDEKELALIQSIIGKHSNEILPKEYYNMLKGRFLYNIYAIPAPKEETSLTLEKSDEIKRYVAGEPIIGAGLYHISSFIHNSFQPNVEVKFLDNNNELSLVALKDLKEGDILTVKYIDDAGKTPEECKELLKKIYNLEDDNEEEKETEKVEEEKEEKEEREEREEKEEKEIAQSSDMINKNKEKSKLEEESKVEEKINHEDETKVIEEISNHGDETKVMEEISNHGDETKVMEEATSNEDETKVFEEVTNHEEETKMKDNVTIENNENGKVNVNNNKEKPSIEKTKESKTKKNNQKNSSYFVHPIQLYNIIQMIYVYSIPKLPKSTRAITQHWMGITNEMALTFWNLLKKYEETISNVVIYATFYDQVKDKTISLHDPNHEFLKELISITDTTQNTTTSLLEDNDIYRKEFDFSDEKIFKSFENPENNTKLVMEIKRQLLI